jgi:nitrile hydratase subunit beta
VTRFSPGDEVLVREDYPPGHIRTPVYLRGKRGVVERLYGLFGNPEVLAYGLQGPRKELYQVCFRAADVWADYEGPAQDLIEAAIYEHWLERVE